MISLKTYLTISIGIAKPMPSAPPETEIIEVLIKEGQVIKKNDFDFINDDGE